MMAVPQGGSSAGLQPGPAQEGLIFPRFLPASWALNLLLPLAPTLRHPCPPAFSPLESRPHCLPPKTLDENQMS